MSIFLHSHAQQLAAILKDGILGGRWTDRLPGVLRLEEELEVNRNTIQAALRILEKEGLLESQGLGRPRRIILPNHFKAPSKRIVILLYEEADRTTHYMVELRHAIQEAGHIAEFASSTMQDLAMNVKKVAKFVEKTNADAWVIKSGTREILEWFSGYSRPAFAFFGRRKQVPLASTGPDKTTAIEEALRCLIELGHRRIVMLVREGRRKPKPGSIERHFLQLLTQYRISSSSYNLPDWEEHTDGFHQCIDGLFKYTPPTALIIDEVPMFLAAQQRLAQLGQIVPKDVSMICIDGDPGFSWFKPAISHIHWSPHPMVKRIVAWANHVATGVNDKSKVEYKADFVRGGTIGPARQP